MRELELIAALEEALGPPPERVLRWLGDDAAVVRAGGALAVTSVDAMVDGVHFRLGEVSWADAGHRALVLVAGHSVHANKSWLYGVQPSELAKVLTIAALAKYYSQIGRDYLELPELFKGGMIVALPMSLVMLQGDLGTAITFVPIFLALSFIAGLKRKYVLVSAVAVLLAAPVGWYRLKDYQKGRIQTIFNPANDPHHLGYQTIQSKIAIGSGRFVGKGFKQGSQSQLGFLPARHTDFVFAVIGEELGLAGALSVIGLWLGVYMVGLRLISRQERDSFAYNAAFVLLTQLVVQVALNVAVVAANAAAP